MDKLRAVYYARVSTEEEQQINALQNQIQELEEFINQNTEWELVGEYIDEGISGTSVLGRRNFVRLSDDLELDKFDIIVVKDESRLMRNTDDWHFFKRRLLLNGKKLFLLIEKKFFDENDPLIANFKAIINEQYSRDLSVKINRAHQKRQKEGKPLINSRMWGYDVVNRTIQINEEEAKVIRFIFEKYADGFGFRAIKQMLDDMNVLNRNGQPFAITSLKRIIRNEKYKGTLVSNKRHKNFNTKKVTENPPEEWIVHKDAFYAIVSEEIWDRANEVLKTKKRPAHIASSTKEAIAGFFKGKYVYSGKVKCGKCGKPYWHQKYNSMINDIWECSSYREFGRRSERGCDNPYIFNQELNSIVKEVIFEYWHDKEENIKKVIAVLDKSLEDVNYNESIDALEKEKKKLIVRKDKLIEMMIDQLISKYDFTKKKEEYESKLDHIERQMEEVKGRSKELVDKKQRMEEVKKNIAKLNSKAEVYEELIDYFLKEVVVHENGELTITLNGDFEFSAEKIDGKFVFRNVSDSRSHGYTTGS